MTRREDDGQGTAIIENTERVVEKRIGSRYVSSEIRGRRIKADTKKEGGRGGGEERREAEVNVPIVVENPREIRRFHQRGVP